MARKAVKLIKSSGSEKKAAIIVERIPWRMDIPYYREVPKLRSRLANRYGRLIRDQGNAEQVHHGRSKETAILLKDQGADSKPDRDSAYQNAKVVAAIIQPE